MDAISAEVGTVYVGYADAVSWVSPLPDDALEDFILRMGEKPQYDLGLQRHALGIVMDEFRDRTLSSRIVRTGDPTVFDRDPRALAVIERMLADMERMTGGYAFEQQPDETQAAVWTAMDIARGLAAARTAGDLHAYLRALDATNEDEFENPADYRITTALEEALAASGIEDDTDLRMRYLGGQAGFLTEEAYVELVRTEGPMRRAVTRAAQDHWQRFRGACGPFNFDKARESFLKSGVARYYDRPPTAAEAALRVQQEAVHAENAKRLARSAEFNRQEREKGFSPYGYWFSPAGSVFPMKGFQIHDTWIRGTLDDGPGLAGRYAALSEGWVSMTMMDDKSSGANIAYGEGAPCQKALKAAARIVRRGGEFTTAVIEAYDGMESAGYEFHDDHRLGARRLNEIAAEVGRSSPNP